MEWKDAFNYGLPTVLLLLTFTGLWRMVVWIRKNVIEPVLPVLQLILKSHLDLIEALKISIPEHSKKLEIIAATAAKVAASQHKQFKEIRETLDSQTGILKQAIDYQTQVIEDKNGGSKK